MHLDSPACLCQGREPSWEFGQAAVAVPCCLGGPLCLGWEIYGRCSVSRLWPHTEQEQAGIRCLEDLLIKLSFVILLLKLMRIKSHLHNKNEHDGVM